LFVTAVHTRIKMYNSLKLKIHSYKPYGAGNYKQAQRSKKCHLYFGTNKSPGKLNIDGSSVKTGNQIFRSRTTLHSLRHSRDNVCGTINDIFLLAGIV